MDPILVAAVLAALVVGTTVLGLVWRSGQGRAREGDRRIARIDGVEFGARATLLQFSSEICSPCVATARVLGDVAADADAVAHVDLDVARHPELAARFGILQTPTTLILDRDRAVRARIRGAVRRDVVTAELERVLA